MSRRRVRLIIEAKLWSPSVRWMRRTRPSSSRVSPIAAEQIEPGRRVQRGEPLRPRAAASGITEEQVLGDQRERQNRPAKALRPLPVQVSLVETVTQIRAGQRHEVLVETTHLAMPLL